MCLFQSLKWALSIMILATSAVGAQQHKASVRLGLKSALSSEVGREELLRPFYDRRSGVARS
jgi:hypothetical protein